MRSKPETTPSNRRVPSSVSCTPHDFRGRAEPRATAPGRRCAGSMAPCVTFGSTAARHAGVARRGLEGPQHAKRWEAARFKPPGSVMYFRSAHLHSFSDEGSPRRRLSIWPGITRARQRLTSAIITAPNQRRPCRPRDRYTTGAGSASTSAPRSSAIQTAPTSYAYATSTTRTAPGSKRPSPNSRAGPLPRPRRGSRPSPAFLSSLKPGERMIVSYDLFRARHGS